MTYRLLALDLDGTVVDQSLAISGAVRNAIAAAQASGCKVTIATGRTFMATMPFVNALGIIDPVICYQGALVRHPLTGEVFASAVIPGDLAAEALGLLQKAGIFTIVYSDERLYVAERRHELDTYLVFHPEGAEVVVEPNLVDEIAKLRPAKLLFMADSDVIERELRRMARHFAGRLSSVRSHAIFGELTPLGITKGTALAEMASQLGIPRDQVIAIGDHENDLPMIEWAGLGLAMGNAIPRVRQIADAVIPTVQEDGVAWAIEKYILTS